MAVDVFMGTLVFARGLRCVHSARPAAHRRELHVRFVGFGRSPGDRHGLTGHVTK